MPYCKFSQLMLTVQIQPVNTHYANSASECLLTIRQIQPNSDWHQPRFQLSGSYRFKGKEEMSETRVSINSAVCCAHGTRISVCGQPTNTITVMQIKYGLPNRRVSRSTVFRIRGEVTNWIITRGKSNWDKHESTHKDFSGKTEKDMRALSLWLRQHYLQVRVQQ